MDLNFFLRGLVLGFSIAAPVGPIGVLCIRRTLADGRVVGLAAGLGAATADALYGAIAGLGLTALSGLLLAQRDWLSLVGGLFLCYLGWRTWRTLPPALDSAAPPAGGVGLGAAFATTFLLTLTNPATILAFAAIFAGVGLADAPAGGAPAGLLILGVFCGSALWWLTLTTGVNLFRARFTPRTMALVNKLAGLILAAFGLLILGERLAG